MSQSPIVFPVQKSGGSWQDFRTFEDQQGTWLTETGAFEFLGLPRHLITRSRKHLARRKVERPFDHSVVRSARKHVYVYFLEDLCRLADTRRDATGDMVEDAGSEWVTAAEIIAQFKVGRIFTHHWHRKPSRLRPGEPALRRRRKAGAPARGGPARCYARWYEYCADDVRRILRGDESKSSDLGRRAHPLPTQVTDTKAVAILGDILADGPLPDSTVKDRAEQQGVKSERLHRAKAKLRVWRHRCGNRAGRVWYWCLPGQAPPLAAHVVLQGILAEGPVRAQEVFSRAEAAGVSRRRCYLAKDRLSILSELDEQHVRYWRLPSKVPPPRKVEPVAEPTQQNGEGQPLFEASPPPHENGQTSGKRRRRGRPKGSKGKKALQRKKNLVEAWQTGEFESIATLADAFKCDRSTASKVLKASEVKV